MSGRCSLRSSRTTRAPFRATLPHRDVPGAGPLSRATARRGFSGVRRPGAGLGPGPARRCGGTPARRAPDGEGPPRRAPDGEGPSRRIPAAGCPTRLGPPGRRSGEPGRDVLVVGAEVLAVRAVLPAGAEVLAVRAVLPAGAEVLAVPAVLTGDVGLPEGPAVRARGALPTWGSGCPRRRGRRSTAPPPPSNLPLLSLRSSSRLSLVPPAPLPRSPRPLRPSSARPFPGRASRKAARGAPVLARVPAPSAESGRGGREDLAPVRPPRASAPRARVPPALADRLAGLPLEVLSESWVRLARAPPLWALPVRWRRDASASVGRGTPGRPGRARRF